MAKDTAHAPQHTERAHRGSGVQWLRRAHTQHKHTNAQSGRTGEKEPSGQGHDAHNTPSGHTGEQEPSGQGHHAHYTPSGHTGEQDPSGQGHRTRNTTHRAGTRGTGPKWPRTPQTPHNTPSEDNGEQGPSDRGDRTHNTNVPGGRTGEREPCDQGHRAHTTPSGHTREQEPSDHRHRAQSTARGHWRAGVSAANPHVLRSSQICPRLATFLPFYIPFGLRPTPRPFPGTELYHSDVPHSALLYIHCKSAVFRCPKTISQGKIGTRYGDTPYWATRGSGPLPSTTPVN